MQSVNPNASGCWIGGYSFGAWIGMQLLMRRPEIDGFIAVSPPAGSLDFSFLAPCPASGLILHGSRDDVVPPEAAEKLAKRLAHQKNVVVEFKAISGADHFFASHMPELMKGLDDYLNKALAATA
jgi:alpha/beta superfamily hydrolase